MKLHLKEIDFDKLTIGTEVYSIWDDNKIKTPIGIVDSKRWNRESWRNQFATIKETIQPDYCECCQRGQKHISYKFTEINLTQLRYKQYNK